MEESNSEKLYRESETNESNKQITVDDSNVITDIRQIPETTGENKIRIHFVEAASKFLKVVKGTSSDFKIKQQFLSKKGLTNDEIKEAFKMAGLAYHDLLSDSDLGNTKLISNSPQFASELPQHPSHYGHHGYGSSALLGYGPYGQYVPRMSLWVKVRDMCNLVVFVFGASYGMLYLYRRYIRPWLTGEPTQFAGEEQMLRLQESVADSLKQLRVAVDNMSSAMTAYSNTLEELSNNNNSQNTFLRKQLDKTAAELGSLKGLLLSKRNFSPTPGVASSIPAWQKKCSALTNGSAESSGGTAASSAGTAAASSVGTAAGAAASPAGAASSPAGTAASPAGAASSPAGAASSPAGAASSPAGAASSPAGVAASPAGVAASPAGVAASPAGAAASSTGVAASSAGVTASSTGAGASSTGVAAHALTGSNLGYKVNKASDEENKLSCDENKLSDFDDKVSNGNTKICDVNAKVCDVNAKVCDVNAKVYNVDIKVVEVNVDDL